MIAAARAKTGPLLDFSIRQERDHAAHRQADQGRRVRRQPVQDDQDAVGQVDRQVGQQDANAGPDRSWRTCREQGDQGDIDLQRVFGDTAPWAG